MTSTLIYEAMNFIIILASEAVALREKRRDEGVTARQQDLISCYLREIGMENADLIL